MSFDESDLRRRMNGALNSLKEEFIGLRTGRASTALLDTLKVDAYGSKMPINQVASLSTPEARLILIQVWDQSMVNSIEKSIENQILDLILRLREVPFVFLYRNYPKIEELN